MPLVMFQNNIVSNYVQEFRKITRGTYAKYHYKSCYYLDKYFTLIMYVLIFKNGFEAKHKKLICKEISQ